MMLVMWSSSKTGSFKMRFTITRKNKLRHRNCPGCL